MDLFFFFCHDKEQEHFDMLLLNGLYFKREVL